MKNIMLIKDGIIVNAIVVEDLEAFQAGNTDFCAGFDYMIAFDEKEKGQPGIGWSYDGVNFTQPVQLPIDQ